MKISSDTKRKISQRKRLVKALGLQPGTVYAKHRAKINKSFGYIKDGHISHFIAIKPKNRRKPVDTRRTPTRHDYGGM